MKLPDTIRRCVMNNIPTWGKRFEKAKDILELHSPRMPKKLLRISQVHRGSAIGNYGSCIVGEFYGFKKQDSSQGNLKCYKGCTKCYDYSMNFNDAQNLKEFSDLLKTFCKHTKSEHGEIFK